MSKSTTAKGSNRQTAYPSHLSKTALWELPFPRYHRSATTLIQHEHGTRFVLQQLKKGACAPSYQSQCLVGGKWAGARVQHGGLGNTIAR